MQLTFFGAAGEVTGSCLLVKAAGVRFLVDCGLFQGASRGPDSAALKNKAAWARDLGRLDFVLLTHAHLDHCGLLPRLAVGPQRPPIYCTRPTADLVPVMLRDSAHVQQRDANGGRGRRGRPTDAPLYTREDVDRLALQLCGVPYDVAVQPHPDVTVTFRSAGHIVGAAFIEIAVRERAPRRTVERLLVVSGDIGEPSPLVVRARTPLRAADVLVLESTYGDRNHRALAATEDELVEVVDEVLHRRRGNLIVPAFALGRAQEFLVLLYTLARAGRLRVPLVFVDSPLAKQAAAVTFAHLDALDANAAAFHAAFTRKPSALPFTLRYTESVEDSMFLNSLRQGAVIIAASGMCEAGRIRHHLRHNLGRSECGVLFTGYQAAGTLGRKIVDGARSVHLFGETIAVRASVHTLGGLSAHAGQDALVEWVRGGRKPQHVFVVHGEPEASHALSARLARELKWRSQIPQAGQTFTL
ncbi:MAG: MBL fold metallo-hydrolase [Burkholderiales bacterium]|nr:MBL fold metallo-hydrolase [Burkholderiales bacterium]